MERIKRSKIRRKPHLDIEVDWKQIIYKNFKTILVTFLFIIVLLLLVFKPEIEENIQSILIVILGSFAGFIIGKKIV